MTALSRRTALVGLASLAAAAGTSSMLSGTATAAPRNNTEKAFDFFVNKGLTRVQSAGVVGNFIVESGRDPINPAAVQYGGGPGRGIAQWEGSRRTALFAYANQRGLPWSNLQLQLDFVWKELTSTEAGAMRQIKATRTVSAAAVAVRKYYERPSVHADQARINAAQKTYNSYANNVEGPGVPPKPPVTPPGETAFVVLKQGSTNKAAVTTLQLNLRARGYKIAADGLFGAGTRSAVIAFQKSKGLVADGVAGIKTWAALVPTLKVGAKGDAVKALQLELRAAAHKIAADGVFGAATKSAVITHQKAERLVADGVAGVKTWGSLVD